MLRTEPGGRGEAAGRRSRHGGGACGVHRELVTGSEVALAHGHCQTRLLEHERQFSAPEGVAVFSGAFSQDAVCARRRRVPSSSGLRCRKRTTRGCPRPGIRAAGPQRASRPRRCLAGRARRRGAALQQAVRHQPPLGLLPLAGLLQQLSREGMQQVVHDVPGRVRSVQAEQVDRCQPGRQPRGVRDRVPGSGVARRVLLRVGADYAVCSAAWSITSLGGSCRGSRTVGSGGVSRAMEASLR